MFPAPERPGGGDPASSETDTMVLQDAEALRAARAAIDRYNAERPVMLETLQRRQLLFVGPYAVLSSGLVFGILMTVDRPTILGFLLPVLALGGWWLSRKAGAPMRDARQSLRDRLLPAIFAFAGPIKYANGVAPQFMQRLPALHVLPFRGAVHDDLVAGCRDGMDFTLCETTLTTGKSTEVVFRGVILYFNLDPPFPGCLLAAKPRTGFSGLVHDFFGDSDLTRILAGRGDLDAAYEFRSDNVAAAAPLLSGPVAELLDAHAVRGGDAVPRLALSGSDAFLLLPTERNFFELPDIDSDVSFDRHVRPMVDDLLQLLRTAGRVRRAIGADRSDAR